MIIANYNRDLFISAIEATGAYGDTILNGIIPILMFWIIMKAKKKPIEPEKEKVKEDDKANIVSQGSGKEEPKKAVKKVVREKPEKKETPAQVKPEPKQVKKVEKEISREEKPVAKTRTRKKKTESKPVNKKVSLDSDEPLQMELDF